MLRIATTAETVDDKVVFKLFEMRNDRRKWIYLVVGRSLLYYPQVLEGLSCCVPHFRKMCASSNFYDIWITSFKELCKDQFVEMTGTCFGLFVSYKGELSFLSFFFLKENFRKLGWSQDTAFSPSGSSEFSVTGGA